MKTVFITAYQGFVSRNIFNTDVLKIIRQQPNVRVVLCVPANKKEFISKLYADANVLVEGIDVDPIIRTRFNKFWYRLAFLLQNSRYVKDQRLERLEAHRNIFGYLNYGLVNLAALILSHIPIARQVFRSFDFRFSPKRALTSYFEKYQPSLIFSTDIFREEDVLFLREAVDRGIRTAGMVRSWDNTTTKGVLRVFPDGVVVNSPILKEELVRFHSYPEKKIVVAGIPQFDAWLSGPTVSRQEFFSQIGADAQKKLIMFAPAGTVLSDTDWQLCEILKKAMDDGRLPSDVQFLVRNHPQHPADLTRFQGDPRFILEVPGSRTKAHDFKGAELAPNEHDHLRNSVYYSEMIMYIATSLSLDATVYDRPQIIVSFDGYEHKPYVKSVHRYNREDCLANLVTLGGVKVAYNETEWVDAINTYLKNPKLDHEGRLKTADRHMFKIDGKAGQRIGNAVVSILDHIK